MLGSPSQSNRTDKAVLLWDKGNIYSWDIDNNINATQIASLKELTRVSQILQLDTHNIIALGAQSDTINYVHLNSQTVEVLLCNGEGCCSKFDSERCHQQSSISSVVKISGISLNSHDHVSLYFSANSAIKKFQIDDSLIQPEVVVDLSDHVDSPGKIKTFTFNEDYSIIFLLWKPLDNEEHLLYRYHVKRKKTTGNIKIQQKELAKISSLSENIVLGIDHKHYQLVALDFESESISTVCLDNVTEGSPGHSDDDVSSSECNTTPHSIIRMTHDDDYIYATDNANSILAINNIKGLYHRLEK